MPEVVEEIVDMHFIEVWRCAFCQEVFDADGPNGLLVHFAAVHPEYIQSLLDRK